MINEAYEACAEAARATYKTGRKRLHTHHGRGHDDSAITRCIQTELLAGNERGTEL